MGQFIDLTGETFGRLHVIERGPNNPRKQATWICECECGKIVRVESGHLRSGHTQSCGCYGHDRSREYHYKHGMTNTKLFSVWKGMRRRCNNPKDPKYSIYGGRGISICDEWALDFQAFYDWSMANGYKDGMSIDRINVNGNYEPTNCRWASRVVQANNTRRNCWVWYGGERLTVAELSRKLDLPYNTVKWRTRKGWYERAS